MWRWSRCGRGARRRKRLAVRGPAPRPGPTSSTARWPRRPSSRTAASGAPSRSWSRARAPIARASSSTRTSSTTTTAPAAESRDPGDPRAGEDSFSLPNGTYTYPTDPVYANNAADLVELRVKPLANATAFRITLNTLKDPSLVATTIAIGELPAAPRPSPTGPTRPRRRSSSSPSTARVRTSCAPATRRRSRRRRRCRSTSGAARSRCSSPTAPGIPAERKVRLAAGVGLWNKAAGRYLLPGDRRHRHPAGGRRRALRPHGLLQRRLPLPRALAAHVPSRQRVRRPGLVARPPAGPGAGRQPPRSLPRQGRLRQARGRGHRQPARRSPGECRSTGPMNRILASHFETKQGADYSTHLRHRQRLPGRAPRAAPALRDLRPQEARPAGRLRPDPAAPLARRQLQPVRRQPPPVTARRARARARS